MNAARFCPQSLATRLQAYGSVLRDLPEWVDESWCRSAGLDRSPRWSGSFANLSVALGVGVPAASAFDSAAHRLATLAPALLARVLRSRALLRRRAALRHCLDEGLRRRLVAWLHPAVFSAVLKESVDDLHQDIDGLPVPLNQGLGEGVDILAWEGFCLFEGDGVWTDRALLRLLRLAFPVGQSPPAGLAAYPGAADGSAWVLARLDRFVPEAPWLCG